MRNIQDRKSKRLRVETAILKAHGRVCLVTNISKNGFAFKCIKRPYFIQDWSVDIIDISGLSLEQVQVKEVWEKHMSDLEKQSPFTVEFGVEFENLSPLQKSQLDIYIRKLEE